MGYLEMAGDKANGAGNISFWGRVYKTDPDGKFTVKVSTDGGTTWTEAGNVTVSGDTYKKYTVKANVTGNVRIRLDQTSGRRVMIDVLSIADYGISTVITEMEDYEMSEPEYYNLQGIRIAEPVKGQLYILVRGREATKIIF